MGNSFSLELDESSSEQVFHPTIAPINNHIIPASAGVKNEKKEFEDVRKYFKELESRSNLTKFESDKLKRHKSAVLIQKIWKGYTQRRKWTLFLTKSQVLRELILTERDYVQFLRTILNVYFTPLKDLSTKVPEKGGTIMYSSIGSAAGNNINSLLQSGNGNNMTTSTSTLNLNLDQSPMTSDEVKIVFSQIEVLLLYNSMLLDKLSSRVLNSGWGENQQKIGDIFLEMIDFLKVPYSHYIMNFPACLKVLEKASKRPSYVLFIQECKSIPEVGKRDLQSFVSMPIQRIPRYVLLLRELIKFTSTCDPDHTSITKALTRMEAIADLINKQMKEDETSKEVIAISNKLKPPIPNLIEPHRRLIREGEVKIYKADGNNHDVSKGTIRPNSSVWKIHNPRFRYFILFNDCLLITKKTKSCYKVENNVSLEYSTVIDYNSSSIKIIEDTSRPVEKDDDDDDDTSSIGGGARSRSNTTENRDQQWTSSEVPSSKDRSSSFSSASSSSINIGSQKKPSPAKEGDRYYFKLHTLEYTAVICLPTLEEKNQWKNDFINVINQITEKSISFNPKWSRNNLIYSTSPSSPSSSNNNNNNNNSSGNNNKNFKDVFNSQTQYSFNSPQKGSLFTADSLLIKQSIQDLLSIPEQDKNNIQPPPETTATTTTDKKKTVIINNSNNNANTSPSQATEKLELNECVNDTVPTTQSRSTFDRIMNMIKNYNT
ncbi:hypothetical protein CYY_002010 [Polysphondylium violaceum]|uniref:Pleckstrin domain-containing protein n=1 Tax=Polysphondylium violaceum TaxID=133409 RepID=A0A8J4V7C1_9MYCE|nr:hypothetical protein CYY_002010 [Polysphondylium violaceum]